jgi:phosphate uptake regulator
VSLFAPQLASTQQQLRDVEAALVRSKAETVAQTEKLALAVLEKEQVSDESAVRVTALQAELDAARKLAELIDDSRSSAMVRPVCTRSVKPGANARTAVVAHVVMIWKRVRTGTAG